MNLEALKTKLKQNKTFLWCVIAYSCVTFLSAILTTTFRLLPTLFNIFVFAVLLWIFGLPKSKK